MKKALPLFLSLFPLVATAADKHVHGEADLFLAIEGQQVLIEWESPAANILGFEHKPHTDEQKAILAKAIEKLNNYQTLIQFSKADCQQVAIEVTAPFTTAHAAHKTDSHDEHKDEHHAEHKDGHKDEHHAEHKDGHHNEHKDEYHSGHKDGHHDEHKNSHNDKGHGGSAHEGEGHSEFHVSYTLQCKNVKPIKHATIDAFKAFPDLEKVTVNWLTTDKQGSIIKTAKENELRL
jgi:hypothetical protein